VNVLLARTGMTRVLFMCLMAIATNAVLIQTLTTDDAMLKNGIRVAVLCVAAVAMIMHNSQMPAGIFLLIIFCVVTLVARQNTDQLSIIFVLILVPALFAVKERSLGKLFMVSSAFSLLLVFALLAAGVTQNEVTEFRGRSTFGTNGVPFFYNLVYGALTMLLVYVHKFKLRSRLFWTLAAVALATHLFNLTDARGGYYAFLGFVVLLYLVPFLARWGLFRFLTALLPVCFLGVAFYIASLYEDAAANEFLSIRPTYYQRFVENLTEADYFLSSTVKQFDRAVTIVDNSYLHLVVGGGLVVFAVFVFMFAQALRRLYRMGKFVDVAFLIATCFYFNSESILLRIENMFVIYFWYLVIRHSTPLFREVVAAAPKFWPAMRVPPVPRMAPLRKPAKPQRLPAWHLEQLERSRRSEALQARRQNSKPGPLPEWARPGRH
jgi:O-antigen ligase